MSRIGLGIDFGTSNSSVALFDGRNTEYLRVDEGDLPEVMPSALYLNSALEAEVGSNAISAYMRENAGRVVNLTQENVGNIEVTVSGGDNIQGPKEEGGAITDSYDVHAYTDRDMPGRLFRSVKRWLGDASLERVRVFDSRYRIVALLTPMLTSLREAADEGRAERPANIWVGRPVHYEGRSQEADEVAVERMLEACGYAGLADVTLYPEPLAAVRSYLHRVPARTGETVLTFDFGGGTLDLTVVRVSDSGFDILATHGIGLGGDAIDRLIYRTRVFPELGEGALIPTPVDDQFKELAFPFREFGERLLNWPLAYELNRPDLREQILQAAKSRGDVGRRFARLYDLVTLNHAYRVFQAIERAKVELSSCDRTTLSIPEIDLELELRRDAFTRLLEPVLAEIAHTIETVLEQAGVEPKAIGVVVRTGGSARIPAVIDQLTQIFPGKVVEHDAFTGIAAGLAISSYESGA
ncbi:MAG: Hsp70 family protein [bacterium]|nr:Hsp70 family protein [bacterium]